MEKLKTKYYFFTTVQQFDICQNIYFWFSIKSLFCRTLDNPQYFLVLFCRFLSDLIYISFSSIYLHWQIRKIDTSIGETDYSDYSMQARSNFCFDWRVLLCYLKAALDAGTALSSLWLFRLASQEKKLSTLIL